MCFANFHKEFSDIARKNQISKFRIGLSNKKYAFEIPDVPSDHEYYEIVYSYSSKSLVRNPDTSLRRASAETVAGYIGKYFQPHLWHKHERP